MLSRKWKMQTQTGIAIFVPVLASYGLCDGRNLQMHTVFRLETGGLLKIQSSAIPLLPGVDTSNE
jgi:hypothetical protein